MNKKLIIGAVAALVVLVLIFKMFGGSSVECSTESHVFQMNKAIFSHVEGLSSDDQDAAMETLQRIGGHIKQDTPVAEQCKAMNQVFDELGITADIM